MKKGLRILLWVVGIVLALVIIVSLLAGPIAKGYVNGHGEELTGRKVHVELTSTRTTARRSLPASTRSTCARTCCRYPSR